MRPAGVPGPLHVSGPADEFSSYASWLPFPFTFPLDGLRMGCMRMEALGREMGLENLWLLLSCWAPEHGATLPTCTFKTLEAAGVMMRVTSQTDRTLIVSSAGNAGAAVLEFGASHATPAIVIVPESARRMMMVSGEPDPAGQLLVCLERATYPDAIRLVGRIVERFGDALVREGGAYNVARRDAMAVPVLRAVQEIGRVPDHYVQAVGSGTGGIAAWEAVMRLGETMRLHLVQNTPFTPMVDAWERGERAVEVMSPREAYERLQKTYSTVLANADPPFGVAGGVFDAVTSTGGDMIAVSNDEARGANALIERHAAIEPFPETGVAAAGLARQVERGRIGAHDVVLLHATGGGLERSIRDLGKTPYPVGLTIEPDDVEAACTAVESYLSRVEPG
ncbi:MAG: pyridoxal-phosphate dependent enzyme [Deltaproteobacteria bacterium]|nr:pyridoxal-phosphate dependent enzyme [Deltaproteobacteria bacterium]